MNSDHVSREAGPPGRGLFADTSNLPNYGDLQFNNQYDPSLWQPDHATDELAFPANQQPHAFQQGWSNTMPTSANPGYTRSQPYAQQTSSPYPGHNFPYSRQVAYNENQLGGTPNTYSLGGTTYGSNANHASTISPQALQHSNVADFTKLVSFILTCQALHLTLTWLKGAQRGIAKNEDGLIRTSSYANDQDDGVALDKVPLKAPRGSESGPFVVIDYGKLAEATKSLRLHNFVNVGTVQIDPGCYLKCEQLNLSV